MLCATTAPSIRATSRDKQLACMQACMQSCRWRACRRVVRVFALLWFSGSVYSCSVHHARTHKYTLVHMCTSTYGAQAQPHLNLSSNEIGASSTHAYQRRAKTHTTALGSPTASITFRNRCPSFFEKRQKFLFEKKPFPPEGTLMSESKEMLLTDLVTRLRR